MTREERLAILGPEIIAEIHAAVEAAPEPTPELVEKLRRIMAHPGRRRAVHDPHRTPPNELPS